MHVFIIAYILVCFYQPQLFNIVFSFIFPTKFSCLCIANFFALKLNSHLFHQYSKNEYIENFQFSTRSVLKLWTLSRETAIQTGFENFPKDFIEPYSPIWHIKWIMNAVLHIEGIHKIVTITTESLHELCNYITNSRRIIWILHYLIPEEVSCFAFINYLGNLNVVYIFASRINFNAWK